MKVLGMGNALVDVLARISDDKLLDELQLPKGSMQLIDQTKFKEVTTEINRLNKSVVSGGSAANTIVGLANLGIETGFIGRVGKDEFGQYYKDDLTKYSVKSHLSEVDETSGVATTFISSDGQRTFGTYLGAAALLNAGELRPDDFVGYNYFYIEGYLVQSHALIERAIVLAKDAGAQIILDLASYNVVEENAEFLRKIIPLYVDIVFANEEEATSFLSEDPQTAVSTLASDTQIAIVKTGAKGSWTQRGSEKVFTPALKVNCIDTTGAGDLYASGFIYGLINNCSLGQCSQIGTILAGNVIQVIGPKVKEDSWSEIRKQIDNIVN